MASIRPSFCILPFTLAILLTAKANVGRFPSIPTVSFPIFPTGWAKSFQHERGKYFEGDILIRNWPIGGDPEDLKAGSYNPRWVDGVIPYTFHPNIQIPGRKAILAAMRDIETKTCIRFKNRRIRKPEKDYVSITSFNQGCYSYVGRDGGGQLLNLGPGCWSKTTIVHELVHAIGFWHEQSRLDRDKYVNVLWNNIPRVYWREFSKHSKLNDFGTTYDYRSVMHYSYNAFARYRGRPTITPKENIPWKLLGTGDKYGGLTETDALQINKMYNCTTDIIDDQSNKIY